MDLTSRAATLRALFPWSGARSDPEAAALDALIEGEQARRGQPDPISGALHAYALTQGAVLKEEFDLATHAHHPAWRIDAITVDLLSLITVNQERGFDAGHALLRATASALKRLYPRGKLVRIHGDCFAALLPPSAETLVDDATRDRVRATLTAELQHPVTVSAFSLEVIAPSHWQLLGPLVWAEAERAHALERRGGAPPVQRRRFDLDGYLPATP
jgi:GGDEF domain-containing protein